LSSPSIDELFHEANIVLENRKTLFDCNRLSLNATKIQYIIFHRRQKSISVDNYNLYVGNDEICRVTSAKFLGFIVDEHLSWELYVSNVDRKLAPYTSIIHKTRNLLTKKSLLLIYNCLVYYNLTYLNSV